ncbi:hypothetical protein OIE66_17345 [Nonomuraea sp. NBC_01738]|uniref:WD40 repeat domain-containing protein n=1 Tax=Nonomuraea sp. NBC_01738 TaxID=2976003 RepID=UPI002E13D2E3|nr:hypothetical protein OIE66_17345 [Nonomuraea sp. NBC_01738]
MPVGAMSPAELREAIVKPAAAANLIVQRELTTRIIDEVSGQPGGLPLMSHALLETWRRHHGKALTVAAYETAGGIRGAVAHTAEGLYAGLTPVQRARLRHLLLRLVTPGEAGAHDTRRPVARAELEAADPGSPLLERLAEARLITLDDTTADLAHEALLTAWPRLRAWVEGDRERLRVHRRLSEAADLWQEHDCDPGSLYQGLRLATARAILGRHTDTLTPIERDFLQASGTTSERARRRGRRRTALLAAVVAVMLVAAALAGQQHMTSNRQERETQARRLVGTAESLRQGDPQQAMRVSLAAWQLADLPETRAALRTASLQSQQDTFSDPDTGPDTRRWLSMDGDALISLGAAGVTRWNLDTQRRAWTSPGLGKLIPTAGLPDGDAGWVPLLGSSVRLRDLTTGRTDPTPLGAADQGIDVSPSGRRLVTFQARGRSYRVHVWDPIARRQIFQTRTPRGSKPAPRPQRWPDTWAGLREMWNGRADIEQDAPTAILSGDDTTMALCVPGAPVQIWDLGTGRHLKTPWAPTLTARQCRERRLYLAPDGRRLLMTGDTSLRQWQLPSGKPLDTIDEPGIQTIGFSGQGTYTAVATATEVQVWRAGEPYAPVFRHRLLGESVWSIRIDPSADQIRYLAGSLDSTVQPSTVRTIRLNGIANPGWHEQAATSAAFSPDQATLATVYLNQIELRDTRTGRRLAAPPPLSCEPPKCHMVAAFRADSTALAYGDAMREPYHAELWDLNGGRTVATSPPLKNGDGLAFADHGDTLLISGTPYHGALTSWRLSSGTLSRPTPGINGDAMAISPSGKVLVTSAGNVADLATGHPEIRGNGIRPGTMAFSPDGSVLAAGDGVGQTALWDGEVRQALGTLTPAAASGPVSALAFAPDSRTLAVGTGDGTIQLWDTSTRRPLGAPISTPAGVIRALTLTADKLEVAGEHIPLLTYDLRPSAAAATICRRARHDLTPEDWTAYVGDHPYEPACGT